MSAGQLTDITTATNLVTKLEGIKDFPKAYNVVHNGTSWNSVVLSVGHDTATTLEPPADQGFITIINIAGKSVQHLGMAGYDTATPGLFKAYGGSKFNCFTTNFTTVPTGSTGIDDSTNLFVTAGNLYLEARDGNSVYQIIYS